MSFEFNSGADTADLGSVDFMVLFANRKSAKVTGATSLTIARSSSDMETIDVA